MVPAVHVDQDTWWHPVPEPGGNPRGKYSVPIYYWPFVLVNVWFVICYYFVVIVQPSSGQQALLYKNREGSFLPLVLHAPTFVRASFCVCERSAGKRALRGPMFVHLVLEGCCTWPGDSSLKAASSQPRGHQAPLQLWKSQPASGSHVVA